MYFVYSHRSYATHAKYNWEISLHLFENRARRKYITVTAQLQCVCVCVCVSFDFLQSSNTGTLLRHYVFTSLRCYVVTSSRLYVDTRPIIIRISSNDPELSCSQDTPLPLGFTNDETAFLLCMYIIKNFL